MTEMDFRMNFKEILIFVAGTTPQIITETIYALSQKTRPVYPDELFIWFEAQMEFFYKAMPKRAKKIRDKLKRGEL